MPTTTTTSGPPEWMLPYIQDYMGRAQTVANQTYQQSPGTYVGPNQTLQSGWNAVANRAMNGNPAMSAAQGGLQNFYNQQQQGATHNPYGQVSAGYNGMQMMPGQNNGSISTQQTGNVYAGQNGSTVGTNRTADISAGNNYGRVSGGANPFASMSNPYLTSSIDSAMGDMTRNWNEVQKPAWDTQMAHSGSFGNAGVALANESAQNDLQKNMGRVANDMRMGAYNQAAGLNESGLNRNMGAQQFNVGTQTDNLNRQYGVNQFNAGLNEAYNGRGMNAQQFNVGTQDRNIDRGYNAQTFNAGLGEAYQNRNMQAQQYNMGNTDRNIDRNMQAQQFNSGVNDRNIDRNYGAQTFNAQQGNDWAGRNDAMYGANQNRMLNAYGMAPQFAQADYNDANALMGVGNQQQTFAQNAQNQNNDWWNQSQQYAGNQLDAYGRRLGIGSGQTSSTMTPNPSTANQVIGGAAAGAALLPWWTGGG